MQNIAEPPAIRQYFIQGLTRRQLVKLNWAFSSCNVKTVTFYNGTTNYIVTTGKIKIDSVTTTAVTGEMYAKYGSRSEINGTFTLIHCCQWGSSYTLCSEWDHCSRNNEDKQEILNGKKRIKKSIAKCFGGCQDVPNCLELKEVSVQISFS